MKPWCGVKTVSRRNSPSTHQQFERMVSGRRALNAGSVGMPYMPDVGEVILRESLLEPADPDGVAQYFESRAPRPDYSPSARSGARRSAMRRRAPSRPT